MREISSSSSLLTRFLPPPERCREIHLQYSLKPFLCHRTTVSGWTTTKAFRHPAQRDRNRIQSNRSELVNWGRGLRRARTASCCRRARFSKSRSRRVRNERRNTATRASRCIAWLVYIIETTIGLARIEFWRGHFAYLDGHMRALFNVIFSLGLSLIVRPGIA